MREIIFRGKRVDNGDLIESNCLMQISGQNPRLWVAFDGWVEINPETVGQYTGLTDKNGKKIFEGDILEITERGMTMRGGVVRFEYGYAGGWVVCDPQKETSYCTLSLRKDIVVIGNIHDSPELINEKEEVKEKPKRPIYRSFSSHDCEAHYECPYCGKMFSDYSIVKLMKEGKNFYYCPRCKSELRYS